MNSIDPHNYLKLSIDFIRYPPALELQTKIDVRKSVFGDKIIDADIVADLLMVLEANSVTKIYDLSQVIASQPPAELRRGEDGYWTVEMIPDQQPQPDAAMPACLKTIKSHQQYIVLSPSLNYIFVDVRDHSFQMQSFKNEDSNVLGKYDPLAFNSVAFSPDPSSRQAFSPTPQLNFRNFRRIDF